MRVVLSGAAKVWFRPVRSATAKPIDGMRRHVDPITAAPGQVTRTRTRLP
jgi:hypothetical protein